MADKRESARAKDGPQRVLDDAARRRRQNKFLESLEVDNFQADPHADLKMNKKAPKFQETNETSQTRGKKRKLKNDKFIKQKFKKTFTILKEDETQLEDGQISHSSARVPPSKFPDRKFCAVCGFPSPYTCVKCGFRFCSGKCKKTHEDTRCAKWVT